MLPNFEPDGLLPPGVHAVTWEEVWQRFSINDWRKGILAGMKQALTILYMAGCQRVWVDGSFVTEKELPGDWDGCWDPVGVDPGKLDPAFLDPSPAGRRVVKTKYMADLFPSSVRVLGKGLAFVDFFQIDKVTSRPKGILQLELIGWKP